MKFQSLLLLLLFAASVSALGFNLGTRILLDKETYSAGETIDASVELSNSDPYPFVDGYVVVQLSTGMNSSYPSQFSQYSVIAEEYSRGIYLLSGEKKTLSVPMKIPSWAPSGNYHLDFYFKSSRFGYVGQVPAFLPGAFKSLKITNSNEAEKRIEILRSETTIEGTLHGMQDSYTGPTGPNIAGSEAKGKIAVQNLQSSDVPLKIILSVAKWDDTEPNVETKTYSYELTAKANANTSIDYSFPSPEIPTAYAVKIEVRDKSTDELYSLYRLRLVSPGSGMRISSIAVDSVALSKGKQANIVYLILPPADALSSFSGTASLEVKDVSGSSLFSDSFPVSLTANGDGLEKTVSFVPSQSSEKYSVSITVSDSSGKSVDAYALDVDASKFSPSVSDASVEIASLSQDQLFLYLSVKDAFGNPADCNALLIASTANGAKRYNLLEKMVNDGDKPSYSLYPMGLVNGTYDLEFYCKNFAGSSESGAKLMSRRQFCLGEKECSATPTVSPSATPTSVPTVVPTSSAIPTAAPEQPNELVSFIVLVLIVGAIAVAVYSLFFKKKGSKE